MRYAQRAFLCAMRFALCPMRFALLFFGAGRVFVDDPFLLQAVKSLEGAATPGSVQGIVLRPVCVYAFQIAKFHEISIPQLLLRRIVQSAVPDPLWRRDCD